jgi:hypothetical protein
MRSTTTTRLCRAIGSSSDQAAYASVPPRTGSSTSPGPPAGMETVTRPTLPRRLSSASTDTFHRLSHASRRFRYTTVSEPHVQGVPPMPFTPHHRSSRTLEQDPGAWACRWVGRTHHYANHDLEVAGDPLTVPLGGVLVLHHPRQRVYGFQANEGDVDRPTASSGICGGEQYRAARVANYLRNGSAGLAVAARCRRCGRVRPERGINVLRP